MSNFGTDSIEYGGEQIYYKIVANPYLQSKIKIHVHPNASVEVEAPKQENLSSIKSAVLKRARWINTQVEQAKRKNEYVLPREYNSGESHFYLGRRHKLRINIENENPTGVKLYRGLININVRVNDKAAIKRRLEDWYFDRANKYIRHRLSLVINEIDWVEDTPPLKLVAMKKQWGSLSPQGIVHINPWLIKAPVDCIDYVLFHELCHLVERNHSKNFYQLLKSKLPDWEHRKTRLDGMAELILIS